MCVRECVKGTAGKLEVAIHTYNRLMHHGTAVVRVHNGKPHLF